jgi:molybdenum cofactor cytidylyltransferase
LNIVGLLLAAGGATRFGADKRLAPVGSPSGEPMAVVACRKLCAAVAAVTAVVRVGDTDVARLLKDAGATVVECANADEGMGASIACGVAAARVADGWIVALADMPWVEASTIGRVADALRAGAPIVAPFHRGRRGHPVGFSTRHRDALLALGGDEGARSVLAANRESLVRVDVVDAGVLRDVDHPHDLS